MLAADKGAKSGPVLARSIGKTGLSLSELGYGAGVLGNLFDPLSDEEAAKGIGAALDAGISYFDTAPYYGFGLSERRVGDALRSRRQEVVLSTKVGRLLEPDSRVVDDRDRNRFRSAMPFQSVFDYSYAGIMRSHADSLQRLGLAQIDILFVHDIGTRTHGEADQLHFDALTKGGGLRALEDLRSAGVIRAFGIGVNEVEACHRVMDHCSLDVVLLAGRYTLLEQPALTGIMPRCMREGTGLVVGGPYNSGILATGTSGANSHVYDYEQAPSAVVAKVGAIEAVCHEHAVPLPAAALQFVLAHPAVVSVVPGIGTAERVEQTLGLYAMEIPSQFWSDLKGEGLLDIDAPVPRVMDLEHLDKSETADESR